MTGSYKRFYEFGPYRVDPDRHQLWRSDQPIPLTSKAFETLLVLVEHSQRDISKDELMKRLWPDTFVEEANLAKHISMVRRALGETAQDRRYIVTLPGHGYRFAGEVRVVPQESADLVMETHSRSTVVIEQEEADATTDRKGGLLRAQLAQLTPARLMLLGALACIVVVGWYLYRRPSTQLTEHDSIIVADFINSTGDPVFDDSLKEALAVQLEQSPFLHVVSNRKVAETLRMMGRPADQPVSGEMGRELCQRIGSKALLQGSISALGDHYVVGLNAVACGSGDMLAREQIEVANKEDVLKELSRAVKIVRSKIGESLSSVQKYDVPIEATTTSLEALKNYSLALKVVAEKGDAPSIPLFKRAIELDPNFPMAYANLAARYSNLKQPSQALEFASKAYQLRDRATDRERLRIAALYFRATGELERQEQIFELWMADYPSDSTPHASLGVDHVYMGQYDKALTEWQEALRLEPENVVTIYENVAAVYLALNRLDEGEAICNQALARKLDSGGLRWIMYYFAFLRNDPAKMQQQVAWAANKAGEEDTLLFAQSQTEAYYGRLNAAREFSRRAVDSAMRADSLEVAALWQAVAALREAEFGNTEEARRRADEALAMSSGRNVEVFSALALARSGETARAKRIADHLRQTNRTNTVLNLGRLPAIDAAIELSNGHAEEALKLLESAKPYELGEPTPTLIGILYVPYLRGQAYLLQRDGAAALREYQKVVDHPGLIRNEPTGPLAHLGLARAYAATGDTANAKLAYQAFLALWSGADPHIPIYKQASVEFTKLR